MWQQIIHGFQLAVHHFGELLLRAIDQIVEILLRIPDLLLIRIGAFITNVKIGIQPRLKLHYADVELFFHQHRQGTFCRCGTRRVGIKVHDDVLAEPAQQSHLRFAECRSGTGDHVVQSGHVHADAVEVPFHHDRVIQLPDRLFGLVQVEKYLSLGIDRTL